MTDRPDEIAEVRRLLAEARHTEPMPDDVAARMDDVLVGLSRTQPVAQPIAQPIAQPVAEVVPLASRRRRKTAAALVAAAAVVVGAVLVASHLPHSGSSSSGVAASAGGAPSGSTQGHDSQSVPGRTTGKSPAPSAASPTTVVRPGHFRADARAAQTRLRGGYQALESTPSCAGVPSAGRVVPAEYRNAPAALVFGPVREGTRVVELYACGSSQPLRKVTLRTP
jgi:hypothetical protein